MRRVLLYLLLFSYTTIVFKPLYPSLADTIAHIFWYSHHVATVHYEHGRYHVHVENREASKKDGQATETNLPKSATDTEHLIVTDGFEFSNQLIERPSFSIMSSQLPLAKSASDFRPPKV
jgi:hypothetical protein